MSRSIRLDFPGSAVWVSACGNAKTGLFGDDADRDAFLALLGRCQERCGWTVFAYVLLKVEYQLVLQVGATKLSRGLQWLNGEYAKFFNQKRRRVGYLFERRPKCAYFDDADLPDVVRSVVLAPVRMGFASLPEEYGWSSHRALMGAVPTPKWLAASDVWARLASEAANARYRYRSLIDAGLSDDTQSTTEVVAEICVGHRAEWIATLRKEIQARPRDSEHPRAQRALGGPDMEDVIASVAHTFALTAAEARHRRIPRLFVAWLASYEACLTNGEIAVGLHLRNHSHISQLVREADRVIAAEARLQGWRDQCLSTLRRNDHRSKI